VLDCKTFYDALAGRGLRFYAGVPDSLLKDFCAYVTAHAADDAHVITANEGSAVALAAGHYLATGMPGVVYLQNSGLGNTVNPLTSLADAAVYGIPMLLVVGWRGQPGAVDEPQHVKMGSVTRPVLDAIGIAHDVLPDDLDQALAVLDRGLAMARQERRPYALLVPKGTFSAFALPPGDAILPLTREAAIARIVAALPAGAPVVSTTGKASRELFELRAARGEAHDTDFLTVGCMGHASQIALGVAMAGPERDVFCIDGDGAAIMHLGGLATIGSLRVANYKHILINNAAHDSVGGQPTAGFDIDLVGIARACGYPVALRADDAATVDTAMAELTAARGPALLEIRVRPGARSDLGRPTQTPAALKARFMAVLGAEES
jgi:phosphonopyruvate decarboxylase